MARLPTAENLRPFSLSAIHEKSSRLGDNSLTPGEKLKKLHEISISERGRVRDEIAKAQALFWRQWAPFRCGVAGDGNPCFDDMIRMLPVRRQFAEFAEADSSSLVVDIGAGSANMAASFRENGVIHYVAIDNNPDVQEAAKRRLATLGLKPRVIQHDIYSGFPTELQSMMQEVGLTKVDYVSNWALTYGSKEEIVESTGTYLNPENNLGYPATLSLNMITDGKFSPKVLAMRFLLEVTPRAIAQGRFRELGRAFHALPQMIKFGKVFTDVAPIWYPNEIGDILLGAGFKVTAEDRKLLWGQSTAMKICR